MSIRVVSKRKGGTEAAPDEVIIHVGRPHILGNPFLLANGANRIACIEKYRVWIEQQYSNNVLVKNTIDSLAARHQRGERIALQCWCAPKQCHADIIKQLVEGRTP